MVRVTSAIALAALSLQLSSGLPALDKRVDFSQHGSDWSQGHCSSRLHQSPIDLEAGLEETTGRFTYFYNEVRSQNITLTNDGRSIFVDMLGEGFGGITMQSADNSWYDLKRIEIKAMSEHTIQGHHSPLELQLVHQRSSISNAAVGSQTVTVAVLLDSANPHTLKQRWPGLLQATRSHGDAKRSGRNGRRMYNKPSADGAHFNPEIQLFLEEEPPVFDSSIDVTIPESNPLQLGNLLKGGTFYMYSGSGTNPPCDERVIWLVRKEKVMASDSQVQTLVDAIYHMSNGFGNFRIAMPRNGREVSLWSSEEEEPGAKPISAMPAKGPPGPADDERENRYIPVAQDSITIAKAAADYAKDMDQRALQASNAYVADLRASASSMVAPATIAPVLVPRAPLDTPWAMSKITQVIKSQVTAAVESEVKDVGPAAANLARSYLRQGILEKAGFGTSPSQASR